MSLLLALFLTITAIASTPHAEPPAFVESVLLHCTPVSTPDFAGCEGIGLDETDYAGWSHGEAVAGP